MKCWKPIAGGLLLGATLLLNGCRGDVIVEDQPSDRMYYNDTDDEIYVQDAPPPDRVEVISARPGDDFIWIDGTWAWHDQWVWRTGTWSRRPREHAVWVRSNWSHDHDRWSYHRGRWKD